MKSSLTSILPRRSDNNIFIIIIRLIRNLIVLGLLAAPANAATYHVMPGQQSGGDGSADRPWSSLPEVLRSGELRGGDLVLLQAGAYGEVEIFDTKFGSPVVIKPEDGADVRFTYIRIRNSSNLTFQNFNVWPDTPQGREYSIVQAEGNTSNIIFDSIDLRSVENVSDYRNWDLPQWRRNQVSGFKLFGARSEVRNSTITATAYPLALTGKGSRIINNKVHGFSGDAIRMLGDNSLISGNFVADCVKLDGNHDDGIQSWSRGPNGAPNVGTVKSMTIIGNTIFEWSGPERSPIACDLQGIFLGDKLSDLVIQNNIIVVSAWHGISAASVTRGLISNNTLANSRAPSNKRPWIGVFGETPRSTIVANNIAPAYSIPPIVKSKAPIYRNVVLANPARALRSPSNGDYRPKAGSAYIDAGNPEFAPETDIDGTKRVLGKGPDIGAYEVQ